MRFSNLKRPALRLTKRLGQARLIATGQTNRALSLHGADRGRVGPNTNPYIVGGVDVPPDI